MLKEPGAQDTVTSGSSGRPNRGGGEVGRRADPQTGPMQTAIAIRQQRWGGGEAHGWDAPQPLGPGEDPARHTPEPQLTCWTKAV